MKKLIFTLATALIGGFATLQAQTKSDVDVTKSTMEWEGSKITGKHNGTVKIKSGSLDVKDGGIVGGTFVIDMNSIVCLDLENADYNAKLVGHLKSDDFFNTADFPTATLKITKVAKLVEGSKAGTHNIYADLTIKGKTQSIIFPATVGKDASGKITAKASFTVDRSKYDVKYGSVSFFPDIADKAISNEMLFNVNIVTK
jgi:polyisoprenoid-binding protein YceI